MVAHEAQPQDATSQTTQQPQSIQQENISAEEQNLQQWLRQIPDDPSGLIKEKMRRQYMRQQRRAKEKEQQWW